MEIEPPVFLLDLNVILDVLQQREGHFAASAAVWSAVERGEALGFIAAHSVTTLFDLLRRGLGSPKAQLVLEDVLSVFEIAPVTSQVIRRALALGWSDFEDAVQMAAAEGCGASHLFTRNLADFKGGLVPILSPAELSAVLP